MSYIENIDSKKQRFKNSARQSKVKKSRLMHFEKKQYYFKQNICKNQYFVKKDLRACDTFEKNTDNRKLFLVRGKILERWSNAHYNISTKSSSTGIRTSFIAKRRKQRNKEQIESVKFSQTPDVRVRVIEDEDPKEIQEQKKKFPFELYNSITVEVTTTFRVFSFLIPIGYIWNGADIPRFLWRLIGSRTDNDFLIASMVHDYLLEFKFYIMEQVINKNSFLPISKKEYRRLTSLIFRHIIKKQGTNVIKSNIMSYCVDVFQMFNRKGWKK